MGLNTAVLSDRELPPLDPEQPAWPGGETGGLFVRQGPTGDEPGLFVHGLGGSSTNWTDLMAVLGGALDAQALDLPGFGRSAPPADGRYTVGAHARAVVRHLDRTGRGPVHLFGNSLGGAVSVRVAADRPDLVRSLTLVSPALPNLRPSRNTDPRLGLLLLPGLRGVAERRLRQATPEQRARAVLELCYGDPSRVSPRRLAEAAAEVTRRSALPHDRLAFQGSLRGLVASYLVGPRRSMWAAVARVEAPTLLVWGERDRLVDVALAPRAARAFPDGRLLVLPGVGHVAQMERPDLVARAFLAMRDTRVAKVGPGNNGA